MGEARLERYKPSTRKGVRYVLESRILPGFGERPLDRIAAADLGRWFDAFSRSAPGHANHCLGILRRILNHAVACGHIAANPEREVKPNRRCPLTRFLA